MDGLGTMVGTIFGSAFPTTVYIGHPAYKRLKGRCGYALGVGIVLFLGAIFGFIHFLYNLIPEAAVAGELVFRVYARPRQHGQKNCSPQILNNAYL